MACVKLSVLMVYYDLFGTVRFRRLIYVLFGIVVAWWVTFTTSYTLACIPIDSMWSIKPRPEAKCVFMPAMYLANAIFNILTDVAVVCLPIRVVWTMQLSLWSKAGLISIFMLGFL